jgi:hypothetical protein
MPKKHQERRELKKHERIDIDIKDSEVAVTVRKGILGRGSVIDERRRHSTLKKSIVNLLIGLLSTVVGGILLYMILQMLR